MYSFLHYVNPLFHLAYLSNMFAWYYTVRLHNFMLRGSIVFFLTSTSNSASPARTPDRFLTVWSSGNPHPHKQEQKSRNQPWHLFLPKFNPWPTPVAIYSSKYPSCLHYPLTPEPRRSALVAWTAKSSLGADLLQSTLTPSTLPAQSSRSTLFEMCIWSRPVSTLQIFSMGFRGKRLHSLK